MKRLLIVTSHRFFEFKNEIFDNYVFNYGFFKDYLKVFDEITVMARVAKLNDIQANYQRASGNYVNFIKVNDARGVKWLLKNEKFVIKSVLELSEYDAICFRIPSMLAYSVWKMNKKTLQLPYMFELIGDPKESLINIKEKFWKKTLLNILGDLLKFRTSKIVSNAIVGSYVSFAHLQKKFPAKNAVKTDTISSIRLDEKYILKKEQIISNRDTKNLNIIHVGSFVAVKNQIVLLDLAKMLLDANYQIKLTFLGDGALLEDNKLKAKKLGISKNVHFKGHVSGFENIIKIIDKNDIFILPSSSEGMPRSLIEAMARGLICFGSDRGGISELLKKEYLFEPDNPMDIYQKIANMLTIPKQLYIDRIHNLEKVMQFENDNLTRKRVHLLECLKSQLK